MARKSMPLARICDGRATHQRTLCRPVLSVSGLQHRHLLDGRGCNLPALACTGADRAVTLSKSTPLAFLLTVPACRQQVGHGRRHSRPPARRRLFPPSSHNVHEHASLRVNQSQVNPTSYPIGPCTVYALLSCDGQPGAGQEGVHAKADMDFIVWGTYAVS